MEKFITANDTALRISDSVKGETTLVLLHGYLESLDVWEDFSELLTSRYRVVAIDIPGHGISQIKGEIHTMEFIADVLHDVLKNLGIGKCFVAGHSMGGYAALAFAAKYPEILQGIILLHSTPNPDTPEKKENRRREIELIRQEKKELLAAMFAPKGFSPENRHRLADRIEELEEQITMTDDDGIIAILNGMMARADQNEMLRGLKSPQLLIFGTRDEFIPVETAESIIAAQPQAEVALLENSGHMGYMEEPEKTADAITAFIDAHTGD